MFRVKSLEDLDKLSKEVKWQYFEKLVGWIFEQNGFDVQVNKVAVYGKTKRQYDVIAERFGKMFIVDCKKWGGNRYKSAALRKAVEKHLERCGLIETGKEKIPIIVTLLTEDITEDSGVPIVPICKLNSFINQY